MKWISHQARNTDFSRVIAQKLSGSLEANNKEKCVVSFHIKDSLLNTAARDQVVKKCFNQATCVHCAKLYEKSRDEIIPLAMLYFDAEKNGILHTQKVIVCCWHKRSRVSHARTARRIENVGIWQVFFLPI